MSGRGEAKAAWDRAVRVSDGIKGAGTFLFIVGVVILLLPWFFTGSWPEWIAVPAAIAGVGFLTRIVGGLWPMPLHPIDAAAQVRAEREAARDASRMHRDPGDSLGEAIQLARARSTDTSKSELENLARNDRSSAVRRAAIETLALLRQAGL